MAYNKMKLEQVTVLREYLMYIFDPLEDDMNKFIEDFTHIKFKNGTKPNLEVTLNMLKAYREYWSTNRSLVNIEQKYNIEKGHLSNFMRRNHLDLKISAVDEVYFKYFGVSRAKYKYIWGGVCDEIEKMFGR